MKGGISHSHRAAASALFTLFSLLAIALGLGDPRPLALAIGASLLSLFFFTRRGIEGALGGLGAPLASLIDLALLFCSISLTGGTRSPFVLLLPAGLALAWQLEGRAAARFFAALSLLGAGALAGLGELSLAEPSLLFPFLAMVLATVALLVALEATQAPGSAPAGSIAETGEEVPSPLARNPQAEILHDLRSPLSVMRVYADLVAEAARQGELPNPEYLANLSREIELAERLVGVPAARSDASPPTSTTADLVEILGSLATAYRLSHGAHLRMEFIAERPELSVAADPVQLHRAFRNILENSIKYTGEGGEVRIRAGAAGPHAFVVVKDTGIGMSQEERKRAFEYAFRGSQAVASGQEGTGLGLALTKEIVESSGGKISLSSEAGYGSEVTILIPFQKGTR